MVLKDETLAKLRRTFDLNLYEVRIWVGLLSRGISTAGELSTISNVPRSRTYDVLESLEKKGFVIMKIGKPIQYIAVSPDDVVERHKKNVDKEADNKIKKLDKVKESTMLKTLSNLYSKGINYIEPTEISGALKGRDNVYNHMENLIKNAKESVCLMTSEEGLTRKADSLKKALKVAKKNGVKIKIAAPITDANSNVLKELKNFAEVKHSKDLDARFVVIDGKHSIMLTQNDKDLHPQYDMGVWLNSQSMSNALGYMFENIWVNLPKK